MTAYKMRPICRRFREEKSTIKELGGYSWVVGPHPHDDDMMIIVGPFSGEGAAWRWHDDPAGYTDADSSFVMFDLSRGDYCASLRMSGQ